LLAIVSIATKYGILQHILCVALGGKSSSDSTNNTTEYEALLLALRKMKALGQQTFVIMTDSKVIQEHIEKESEARNPVLMKYLEKSEKWKDISEATQCNTFQEMTTTKQTN
jgi:ribonuclease HI